jgi:hypothetical protein
MARKGKRIPATEAASGTPPDAAKVEPSRDSLTPAESLAVSHLSGDPEFVHHSEAKEVARRTAKGCKVWYRSPAVVEFLVEARKVLLKSSKMQGWPVAQVKRVEAYFNKLEEAIYIVAADPEDTSALPVSGWSRKATVNLYELMASHSQDLEQGKSILCQATYSERARVGPALVIPLKNPVKTTWSKEAGAKANQESGKNEPTETPGDSTSTE